MPHNLAIVGYGKMGQLIESLAPEYGFAVTLQARRIQTTPISKASPRTTFATSMSPSSSPSPPPCRKMCDRIAALGVNLVVGTTGWLDQIQEVRQAVESAGTGLVWSPNFSIGVHAFFRIVAEAARLLASEKLYEAGPGRFITRPRRTPRRVRC